MASDGYFEVPSFGPQLDSKSSFGVTTFGEQSDSDRSYNMPSFDYSFDDAYNDNYSYDNFAPDSADDGNLYETSASYYDNLWATDAEINEIFNPILPANDAGGGGEEGGFWGGVWDFLSSDGMLNALGGMANLGLDMWKSSLNKPPTYTARSSGGGSGGRTIHDKDAGKLTEKPHTFTRK